MSEFNQKEYVSQYKKKNYRSIQIPMSFDDANAFDNHIKLTGEKKAAFIKRAIKETIEEESGISFNEATEY